MVEWHIFANEKPTLKTEFKYVSEEMLVTIPQSDGLKTIAARWAKTVVRNKEVERWERNGRLLPWTPVHWAHMPPSPNVSK